MRWGFFPKDEIGFLIPAAGECVILEGTIRTTPTYYPSENDTRKKGVSFFKLDVRQVKNGGCWEPSSGTILADVEGDLSCRRIGDAVRVTGFAYHIRGPMNPGEYNRAFQNRAERILIRVASGSVSEPEIIPEEKCFRLLSRFFERVRLTAQKQFYKHLSKENAELASAVILGIRSGLDEGRIEQFSRTGTSHLLAISGLHVSLVSCFLIFLVKKLSVPSRVAAVILFLSIWGYVMMTGMKPPALRAAALFWVFCLSLFFRRRSSFLNSFALSAILVLLMNPASLFQTGTHLSFIAAGIFVWIFDSPSKQMLPADGNSDFLTFLPSRRFTIRFRSHRFLSFAVNKGEDFIRNEVLITFVSFLVQIILLPIVLAQIHLFAPIGFWVNPVIWLPFQYALVFSLLLLGLGWIPFLGICISFIADKLFDLVRYILDLSQTFSWGAVFLPGPSLWWMLGFYLPFILWTFFPEKRPRYRIIFTFVLAWVSVGMIVYGLGRIRDYQLGRLGVDILSVGHGSANLLFYPSKTVLYDCGSMGNPKRAARAVEADLFQHKRRSIDLILLSHSDIDHFNGVRELLNTVKVRGVAVSESFFLKNDSETDALWNELKCRNIPIFYLHTGDNLRNLGLDSLQILHPGPEYDAVEFLKRNTKECDSDEMGMNSNVNMNPASLVVQVEWLGRRLIFPGDIDCEELPPFLSSGKPLSSDLVVIPHHGGHSKDTEPFLKQTSPGYAVVSEAEGKLSPEREAELVKFAPKMRLMNTAEFGAVQVRIEKSVPGETKGKFTLQPSRYPALP